MGTREIMRKLLFDFKGLFFLQIFLWLRQQDLYRKSALRRLSTPCLSRYF